MFQLNGDAALDQFVWGVDVAAEVFWLQREVPSFDTW
jgi:hypothetical protein